MVEMFRYLVSILENQERRNWKILTVLDFISPVMDLFNFSVIIYIINIVIREQKVSDKIIIFTLFMSIASIVKGFFDIYKCKVQNQLIYDGSRKVSMKLYEVLIKENLTDHNRRNPMQALAMVRSDAQGCMNIIVALMEIWINIFMMVGYYIAVIYVSGWMGVISCIAFTCFMVVMFFQHRSQMKIYGEKSRINAIRANAQVTIAYGCFKEIKLSGRLDNILYKYQTASSEYAQIQREYQYNRIIISMIMQNLVMAIIYVVLAGFLWNPREHIGYIFTSMVMYFTVLIRMIPMANSIVNGLNSVEFSKKSYEIIKQGLNEYENIKERELLSKSIRQKKISFRTGLSVRNLSFAYNDCTEIFMDASIDIPAGSSVAIIGVSGIGKTTFLDLILGLLMPQSGNIFYDDYDIVTHMDDNGICKADIGEIVSYIPQTVYLNGETVRNNVAFFDKESSIDDSRLVECLKCAQVWEDVMRMPDEVNTVIGENGISISGGQRQRIALARALYKDFELLIMDEATAALDMETEKAVIDSIRQIKKNKTILIATHHMSLANECDMIYRIENQRFIRIK